MATDNLQGTMIEILMEQRKAVLCRREWDAVSPHCLAKACSPLLQ
jgi:hypothetical protein